MCWCVLPVDDTLFASLSSLPIHNCCYHYWLRLDRVEERSISNCRKKDAVRSAKNTQTHTILQTFDISVNKFDLRNSDTVPERLFWETGKLSPMWICPTELLLGVFLDCWHLEWEDIINLRDAIFMNLSHVPPLMLSLIDRCQSVRDRERKIKCVSFKADQILLRHRGDCK